MDQGTAAIARAPKAYCPLSSTTWVLPAALATPIPLRICHDLEQRHLQTSSPLLHALITSYHLWGASKSPPRFPPAWRIYPSGSHSAAPSLTSLSWCSSTLPVCLSQCIDRYTHTPWDSLKLDQAKAQSVEFYPGLSSHIWPYQMSQPLPPPNRAW